MNTCEAVCCIIQLNHAIVNDSKAMLNKQTQPLTHLVSTAFTPPHLIQSNWCKTSALWSTLRDHSQFISILYWSLKMPKRTLLIRTGLHWLVVIVNKPISNLIKSYSQVRKMSLVCLVMQVTQSKFLITDALRNPIFSLYQQSVMFMTGTQSVEAQTKGELLWVKKSKLEKNVLINLLTKYSY